MQLYLNNPTGMGPRDCWITKNIHFPNEIYQDKHYFLTQYTWQLMFCNVLTIWDSIKIQ